VAADCSIASTITNAWVGQKFGEDAPIKVEAFIGALDGSRSIYSEGPEMSGLSKRDLDGSVYRSD